MDDYRNRDVDHEKQETADERNARLGHEGKHGERDARHVERDQETADEHERDARLGREGKHVAYDDPEARKSGHAGPNRRKASNDSFEGPDRRRAAYAYPHQHSHAESQAHANAAASRDQSRAAGDEATRLGTVADNAAADAEAEYFATNCPACGHAFAIGHPVRSAAR